MSHDGATGPTRHGLDRRNPFGLSTPASGTLRRARRAFREEGFRVVETRRSRRLAGTDETDYLPELRRDRGVFVTSDQQLVERIRAGRYKHPGVVFLDRQWNRETMGAQAGVIAETIKAAIDVLGPTGFYNMVLEPALDGLYSAEGSDQEFGEGPAVRVGPELADPSARPESGIRTWSSSGGVPAGWVRLRVRTVVRPQPRRFRSVHRP